MRRKKSILFYHSLKLTVFIKRYLLVIKSGPQQQQVRFQQMRRYEMQIFHGLQINQVTFSCQASTGVPGVSPGQTRPPHGVAASPSGQPASGALSWRRWLSSTVVF